ncbi:hypothetical protein [Lacticaseibacillus mingshuiensis]|uniref:MacB-like periplasmic core domain-containing protein n=1 Tax=Lacticaseibacillus mingshuiensis TaxID=2799574 RepID=A0ABW4CFX8_9LACO|nr:hypothetical protein [Lacticaseibacillus mingshuiensis]
MKRFFVIDLLWVVMIVLAGWTWSWHDQNEYADRLAHFGLSEDGQVFKTDSAETLQAVAEKLTQSDVQNVQVQFQDGKRIYVWGNTSNLPLQDGQWFTQADLTSALPVAVVGQNQTATLVQGNNQQYLKQAGRFIPVIGTVGTHGNNALNDVTFFNASATDEAAPRLNAVTIIADGSGLAKAKTKLQAIFSATSDRNYSYQLTAGNSWWADNGPTILRCAGIGVLAVIIAGLTIWLMVPSSLLGMDRQLHAQLRRGLWTQTVTHTLFATVIGVTIDWWWLYLTNRVRLVIFAAGLWLGYLLIVRAGVSLRYRKGGTFDDIS